MGNMAQNWLLHRVFYISTRTKVKVDPWCLGKFFHSWAKPVIYCDIQSRLAQFRPDFVGKALVLVNPTELEIFWPGFIGKALVLINPDA